MCRDCVHVRFRPTNVASSQHLIILRMLLACQAILGHPKQVVLKKTLQQFKVQKWSSPWHF